jgi:hypothetical protein
MTQMELNVVSLDKLLAVYETIGELRQSLSEVTHNLKLTNQRLATLKNRVDYKIIR